MFNLSARFKIDLGYQCNNHCRFCINSEKRTLPPKTTEEVKKEIILARQNNIISLELLGGEPTIRPDIIEIIKFATKMGFRRILLETNGRMLSYLNFARKIVGADPLNIMFSIHGHNAKMHDFLTRTPGSFYQLMKGLENLRRLNFQNLTSNTIVTKYNYRYLFQIGKFIYSQGIKDSNFIFPYCNSGQAYYNFEKIVPKISRVTPFLRECLKISKEKSLNWKIGNFPLCGIYDYLNYMGRSSEKEKIISRKNINSNSNLALPLKKEKIKTKRCNNCKLHNICDGIFKEYFSRYGDRELKPVPQSFILKNKKINFSC